MSTPKKVSPAEAQSLVAEGYVYVDVRTEAEFADGHPPGALNVPIAINGVQNPEFLPVMEQAFGKGARIVVGCKAGPRSRRAAELLLGAGFTDVVDMSAGFGGTRDEFGRPVAGWAASGLPVETGAPDGQGYADVKRRKT